MDISREDLDLLLLKRQSLREALGQHIVHSEEYQIIDSVLLNVGKLEGSVEITDGKLHLILTKNQIRDLQLRLMTLRAQNKAFRERIFRETTYSRQQYARRRTALTARQIKEIETLLGLLNKEVII